MNAENPEALPEDATRLEVGDALFEGTRLLNEMAISFEARAEEAQWLRLIEALKFEDRTAGAVRMAGFVALPDKHEPFSPYLAGGVALKADQPGVTDWYFEWARAPTTPPPSELLTLSAAVGGFPKILDKLGELWPTSTLVQAKVSATYFIDSSEWRLRRPFFPGKKLQQGERQFRVTPTHWQIEPASGPVQEIISSRPEADSLYLTGKGIYTLRWTPRFLNQVDGAIWGGLKTFLESR